MKYAIVGSRDFERLDLVARFVQTLTPKEDIVVSGGARGVDSIAETTAEQIGVGVISFRPDWETYGKKAGIIRNKWIIDEADRVVAFWDGKSKGTKHSIDLAIQSGKPLIVRIISEFRNEMVKYNCEELEAAKNILNRQ